VVVFWRFDECGDVGLGQVRHPNVLAFLHSTEAETMDGGVLKPTVYLVTEPVVPLAEKIQELDLQGTQRYTMLYYRWNFCSLQGWILVLHVLD
jgi:hypothetical protein